MKKYFIPGLVILLPLALTVSIVLFIFNVLTEPFVGLFQGFLDRFGLLDKGFLFFSAYEIQIIVSKILILIFLFFFTVLLGFLGRWVFIHYLLRFWDQIMKRIPFVRNVYKTSQDVINTLFSSTSDSFSQVVLVPFPNKDTYCMGFVARTIEAPDHMKENELVAVFIPTTPNPTSGFLSLVPKKNVTVLDMRVEDGVKFVVSCGTIFNGWNPAIETK